MLDAFSASSFSHSFLHGQFSFPFPFSAFEEGLLNMLSVVLPSPVSLSPPLSSGPLLLYCGFFFFLFPFGH